MFRNWKQKDWTMKDSQTGATENKCKDVFRGIGIGVAAAFLFYRSVWALFLVLPATIFCVYRGKKRVKKEKTDRIQRQFQSAMQSVAGALGAGYSLEYAWRYAQGDMQKLYGSDAEIVQEFACMNRKIHMSEPLEQVFYEFACRSECEDIYHFAEILLHVKRSGGNITEIIRTTVTKMQEKTEVLNEIQTAVAAKRAEQRVMMILMPLILLFITISSPEYAGALYENPGGVIVMSACLCGYLGVFFWSENIVDIPV